jgi:ABC-type Fe3+-hydroxamate transport system substrate-binding protein
MQRLDDLGFPVRATRPAARVVSLVPSLTEAIAVTRRGALAGATQWCTHPAGLDVPRVRGTKNPDVRAIVALRPDIVLANQEENRQLDVDRLRAAGVSVWVTVIRSVEESLKSLRRMFTEGLGWPEPAWLSEVARVWALPSPGPPDGPPPEPRDRLPAAPPPGTRAVICVWRDPWMVVGSDTFTGDLAGRLGLANVFGNDGQRYPRVGLADILARDPQVIVLPDEPYAFTERDGPEAFPGRRVALVSGRDLTWYGPSLVAARERLTAQLA